MAYIVIAVGVVALDGTEGVVAVLLAVVAAVVDDEPVQLMAITMYGSI